MPTKISFIVVYASSEDEKHQANELNTHGPTVRGWQSAKNCSYPQEIIFKLNTPATLHRIQVLAHQYLIPEKIELWISDSDIEPNEVQCQIFDYLGYITLADNQSTGFKSRELKSVSVPTKVATYLKIRLSKNHENAFNINNQISLIAINILGIQVNLEDEDPDKTPNNNENQRISNPQYLSIYDDLAFEMYVDNEVAGFIRQMDANKQKAVLDERFEYARKLKVAIEKLREAGEKLGKYDLEKRHAIDMEDYERARRKKTQGDEFRQQIYQQLQIQQLLENNGQNAANDVCTDLTELTITNIPQQSQYGSTEMELLSPPTLTTNPAPTVQIREGAYSPNVTNNIYQGTTSPLHQFSGQNRPKSPGTGKNSPTNNNINGSGRYGSFRRRNKSAGAVSKSSYEAYEERTVPALRHSHTNEFLRECQLEIPPETKTPSKLNEREKKQAALPILVFGNDLVEKFYSKQYSDKEEGLNRLKDEMRQYDNNPVHTANKTARAAIFLLHRALRDKVFSVYSLAAEVIRLFFIEFVPGRVSQTEVARSIDRLLPELLTKSGDPTPRIHNMAIHTILSMVDCQHVRELHLIPVHLTRPVSSSTHPRLAQSRMEMVEQLILNHGISTEKQSGLTCRVLSEFGSSGLHHPAEPVRKIAERVLVLVYKVNPRLVRKQLPPDDDITRRNLLYRHLFHEFDKVDLQRKKDLLEKSKQESNSGTTAGYTNTVTKSKSSSNVPNSYLNHEDQEFTIPRTQSESNPPKIVESKSMYSAKLTDVCQNISNVVQFEIDNNTDHTNQNILPNGRPKSMEINEEARQASFDDEYMQRRYSDNQKHDRQVNDQREITETNNRINNGQSGDNNKEKDDMTTSISMEKHGTNDDRHHSNSSTSGVSSPSDSSQREGYKQCIFCSKQESSKGNTQYFTDEQLNSHYWRTCPMLTRCIDCDQVVEVSTLIIHRLVECENSKTYRQCRRCREAVPLIDYIHHVTDMKCVEALSGFTKCPLCHENIPHGELNWRDHMMGDNSCPKNVRGKNAPPIRSKSAYVKVSVRVKTLAAKKHSL